MPKVDKSIEIKGNARQFIDSVVLDFEKYPEFVKDLREVKVLKHEDDTVQVSFRLHVVRDIIYTLALRKDSDSKVSWELVKGDFMKRNSGFWEVRPLGDGTIQARYSINVELPFFIPKSITKTLISTTLPTMLESFKARAESLHLQTTTERE